MKRVYYEEASETYLVYRGREKMLEYQEEMFVFVLPSHTDFLLKHMEGVCCFLDDIYEALYEREKEEESASHFEILFTVYDEDHEQAVVRRNATLEMLNLPLIASTLLQWHSDIITRHGETMTGAYAVCYFLSWGVYARAFHLRVSLQSDKLSLYAYGNAYEHHYCEMVSKRSNVVITDARLIDYSVDELWTSMRIITPSLYTYPFSLPMRNYVYALFFRYADLLSMEQDGSVDIFDNPRFVMPSHHEEEEEEEEEMMTNIEGHDDFDDYKKLKVSANHSYAIQSDFVYEGELLFFNQLYRLQLSTDLTRYHEREGLRVAYTPKLNRLAFIRIALEQWSEALVILTRDTQYKESLVTRYTHIRTDMYLCHGDRQRHKRAFPTSACDARDVLLEARPLEMDRVTRSQGMVLGDLILCFKRNYTTMLENCGGGGNEDYEGHALQEGGESWLVIEYEQEALLLTRICTRLFMEYHKVKGLHKMDDAFLFEELVSLQRIEKVFFLGKTSSWPVFLKLMRFYYVMDTTSKKMFKSVFFVEAYFVWLCLCLRNKVIVPNAIHPKLLGLTQKLNDLLQW